VQVTNFDPSFPHPNGFSGRIVEDRQTVRGMIRTSVLKIDKTSSGALPREDELTEGCVWYERVAILGGLAWVCKRHISTF
jgi:hypothetical protein